MQIAPEKEDRGKRNDAPFQAAIRNERLVITCDKSKIRKNVRARRPVYRACFECKQHCDEGAEYAIAT